MTAPPSAFIRVAAIAGALFFLTAASALGYMAVVAARRSEGVFMPLGYVALICLICGAMLVRIAARS